MPLFHTTTALWSKMAIHIILPQLYQGICFAQEHTQYRFARSRHGCVAHIVDRGVIAEIEESRAVEGHNTFVVDCPSLVLDQVQRVRT